MPPGIAYIVSNEAAERFSFYGMKGILLAFMTKFLVDATGQPDTMGDEAAKSVYHLFTASVYFFPLLGAILADTLLGKYRTIVWLSVVYCLGHGVLALMDVPHLTHIAPRYALYFGLLLVAVGSGGIKPCVSAHVGDQFGAKNAHLLSRVFGWFYLSINLGAFASTILTPWLLYHPDYGPPWAFGIPGVLMAIATLVFWLGRHRFAHIPPDPAGLNAALADAEGRTAIGRLLPVFGFIIAFWMLFDQTGGEWILQGSRMDQIVEAVDFETTISFTTEGPAEEAAEQAAEQAAEEGTPLDEGAAASVREEADRWGVSLSDSQVAAVIADLAASEDGTAKLTTSAPLRLLPSQMQSANPLLILILVPTFSYVVFPLVGRFVEVTPLRKIGFGIALAGVAFLITGLFERRLEAGGSLHILWQLLPYTVLTAAEVLVSITSLEFAYTQSPRPVKSIVTGLYLLSISLANLVVSGLNAVIAMARDAGNESFLRGASYHDTFAVAALLAAIGFALWSRRYEYRTYLHDTTTTYGNPEGSPTWPAPRSAPGKRSPNETDRPAEGETIR